jgi:phosphoglycerate dehydrogenase-like enzyme
MLPRVDHLVLAAPATPKTAHLIGADELSVVKAGVHLVNIARGALVDQDALRTALDDGRVAMASLDVCDPEPLPAGHWIYGHPQVRLSPHISWSSPSLASRIVELLVDNIRRYVAGEPLEGVVDPVERY